MVALLVPSRRKRYWMGDTKCFRFFSDGENDLANLLAGVIGLGVIEKGFWVFLIGRKKQEGSADAEKEMQDQTGIPLSDPSIGRYVPVLVLFVKKVSEENTTISVNSAPKNDT